MGRVEGVGHIEERKPFRMEVAEPDEDDVAGHGVNAVEVIKHVLISVGVTLSLVLDTIGQIMFVEHLLQITFNRFVEGREYTDLMTRSE